MSIINRGLINSPVNLGFNLKQIAIDCFSLLSDLTSPQVHHTKNPHESMWWKGVNGGHFGIFLKVIYLVK